MHLIKRLRKAKKEGADAGKPTVVKTHLRNMIIVPEMVGSVIGVHNGLNFTQVEVKVIARSRCNVCMLLSLLLSWSAFVCRSDVRSIEHLLFGWIRGMLSSGCLR